jgi:hypothetical protein
MICLAIVGVQAEREAAARESLVISPELLQRICAVAVQGRSHACHSAELVSHILHILAGRVVVGRKQPGGQCRALRVGIGGCFPLALLEERVAPLYIYA